jgi:peptidoglycan hydrolase-like protein with peptidoglycan-binding domain
VSAPETVAGRRDAGTSPGPDQASTSPDGADTRADQAPASPDQAPAGSGQASTRADQAQADPAAAPAGPDQAPAGPDEAFTGRDEAQADPDVPPRRRWGRRAAVALATVGLVAAVGVGSWVAATRASRTSAAAARPADPAATATVRRGDLVSTEEVDGALGYAANGTGAAASSPTKVVGTLPGTVTKLPVTGAVIKRGQVLYELDGGTPVVFMRGDRPAWRPFTAGMSDGPDVRQLERNLKALGFDPDGDMTVDDDFTWATTAAIKRWQESRGLDETGEIPPGQVRFLPWGSLRVASLTAQVGTPGSAPLMTVTSTTKQVTVQLDATLAHLVRPGQTITVELPGGTTTKARVSTVGTVATAPSGTSSPTPGTEQTTTVPVTATLSDQRATGSLDQAPVTVEIVTQSRHDVLSVPVTALLALAEGGYGVEVARPDGGRQLVPVRTGLFSADGNVEVSGAGLRAGDRVVTAP